MQEIEIQPYEQMVYTQPRICPGKSEAETPLGFWDTNRSPNIGPTTRTGNNQQEKENLPNCGLYWSQSKIKRKQKERLVFRPLPDNWKKIVEHESEKEMKANAAD